MSASALRSIVRLFSRSPGRECRDCVLREIYEGSVGAEIGVYRGDFSERILRRKPRKLHLIDPWKFEPDAIYAKSFYGGTLGKDQSRMDAIYKSVIERFRSAIVSGIVEVHRSTSAECASHFRDNYFDWIYIDGNHQYQFVMQDLELFLPKIRRFGLVAGDDYGTVGWWQDGVTRAVDETVASGQCEELLLDNHQFVLRKL